MFSPLWAVAGNNSANTVIFGMAWTRELGGIVWRKKSHATVSLLRHKYLQNIKHVAIHEGLCTGAYHYSLHSCHLALLTLQVREEQKEAFCCWGGGGGGREGMLLSFVMKINPAADHRGYEYSTYLLRFVFTKKKSIIFNQVFQNMAEYSQLLGGEPAPLTEPTRYT